MDNFQWRCLSCNTVITSDNDSHINDVKGFPIFPICKGCSAYVLRKEKEYHLEEEYKGYPIYWTNHYDVKTYVTEWASFGYENTIEEARTAIDKRIEDDKIKKTKEMD